MCLGLDKAGSTPRPIAGRRNQAFNQATTRLSGFSIRGHFQRLGLDGKGRGPSQFGTIQCNIQSSVVDKGHTPNFMYDNMMGILNAGFQGFAWDFRVAGWLASYLVSVNTYCV
jgi:hypothetical protein